MTKRAKYLSYISRYAGNPELSWYAFLYGYKIGARSTLQKARTNTQRSYAQITQMLTRVEQTLSQNGLDHTAAAIKRMIPTSPKTNLAREFHLLTEINKCHKRLRTAKSEVAEHTAMKDLDSALRDISTYYEGTYGR